MAHVDAVPTREQATALVLSALRVSLAAILFYLCVHGLPTADGFPLMRTLRAHADEISGVAAAFVAFEFLVFAARARRAAQPTFD